MGEMKLPEAERVRRIAAYRAWRDEMANRPPPLIGHGMGRVITSEQIWLAAWSAAAQAERAGIVQAVKALSEDPNIDADPCCRETIGWVAEQIEARPSDESRT